ncbi:MAG: acyl-CoA-binding protein [Anaerolineales bacterium]|nr:acyl-CoA-binding protein [Anaerolineales bacterium]
MSSELEQRFLQAQADAKALPVRPGNNDLLALYSYFKQATQGDCTGSRPGMMDFANRAKYDAWAKLKGTGREAAMQAYVDKVGQLKKG